MPGYILHLTEATLICSHPENRGMHLSNDWKNEFFLGSLLPDTKIKKEKVTSHFWNPNELVNLAIAPDLKRFLDQYASCLTTPLMLGYWAHLFLDTLFVNDFWKRMFEFQNEEGQVAVLEKDIRYVYLRQMDITIPKEDFFSRAYYYGDYNRMNAYIADKYQIKMPLLLPGMKCPVKEVAIDELHRVLTELQDLMDHFDDTRVPELKVFSLPDLEQFIQDTAQTTATQILSRNYTE